MINPHNGIRPGITEMPGLKKVRELGSAAPRKWQTKVRRWIDANSEKAKKEEEKEWKLKREEREKEEGKERKNKEDKMKIVLQIKE